MPCHDGFISFDFHARCLPLRDGAATLMDAAAAVDADD